MVKIPCGKFLHTGLTADFCFLILDLHIVLLIEIPAKSDTLIIYRFS